MLKYHLRPVFCILISILYNYTKSYSNLEGLVDQELTEIQKKNSSRKENKLIFSNAITSSQLLLKLIMILPFHNQIVLCPRP